MAPEPPVAVCGGWPPGPSNATGAVDGEGAGDGATALLGSDWLPADFEQATVTATDATTTTTSTPIRDMPENIADPATYTSVC